VETEIILRVEGLAKTYPDGTRAVRGIDFEVRRGELVSIIGPSGAGKSTLLRCVNRLIQPTSGEIYFRGRPLSAASQRELRAVRREIGMVFQSHNLIRRLPAVHNVLHGRLGYMSAWRGGMGLFSPGDTRMALELLERVGLAEHAFKRADELSGGQQQRAGIARALAQRPTLLMADEPIASLDPASSETVMTYMKEICEEDGLTALVNLHQVEFARRFATRIIGMREGVLVFDGTPDRLTAAQTASIYGTGGEHAASLPAVRTA
jgi:phosphonate transport system ATP-binding protein